MARQTAARGSPGLMPPPFDRIIAVGMRRWKAQSLRPLLTAHCTDLHFARNAAGVRALAPTGADAIAIWGASLPPGTAALANASGAALLRIEDGFIRSVGLGSDLIAAQSLIIDRSGIYFDATAASDLETMLQTKDFTPAELAEAAQIRDFIVAKGLTKYNIEPRLAQSWPANGRCVVLVPGQVETDASIMLGGAALRTNLGLLQAVRAARPDAWIVYKPHPDVMSGNRSGRIARREAGEIADWIESEASIVSCIEACDEVHTITSLSGFDALLRGKPVVTYGAPFYAGWGLTDDRAAASPAWSRRTRRLTLDTLVAGALLHYPIYWNSDAGCIDTCKTTLSRIADARDVLQGEGRLEQLRSGWARRQMRKSRVLAGVFFGGHKP